MLKSEDTLENIVNNIINDRSINNCQTGTTTQKLNQTASRRSISPANRGSISGMTKSYSSKNITPGRDSISVKKRLLDSINDPKFPGLQANGPFNRASLSGSSNVAITETRYQQKDEILSGLKTAFKSQLFGKY